MTAVGDTVELHPKALKFPITCFMCLSVGLVSYGLLLLFSSEADFGLQEGASLLLREARVPGNLHLSRMINQPNLHENFSCKDFSRCGIFSANSRTVSGKEMMGHPMHPYTTSGQSSANI